MTGPAAREWKSRVGRRLDELESGNPRKLGAHEIAEQMVETMSPSELRDAAAYGVFLFTCVELERRGYFAIPTSGVRE